MDDISWTVLGSASGNPSPERANAGQLLTIRDTLILFDCGSGVVSSFLKSGFEPASVKAVFISHTHPDHCSDLPFLIQTLYLFKKNDPLDIFVPEEAVVLFANLLSTCYLFKEKLGFDLQINPIESRHDFPDDRVAVTPIPNKHLKNSAGVIEKFHYPNRMQSYSFRIEIDNQDILYSSDLDSLDDIADYADNLDLLVVEMMHIDFDDLTPFLKRKTIKRTLLTHVKDVSRPEITRKINTAPPDMKIELADDCLTLRL